MIFWITQDGAHRGDIKRKNRPHDTLRVEPVSGLPRPRLVAEGFGVVGCGLVMTLTDERPGPDADDEQRDDDHCRQTVMCGDNQHAEEQDDYGEANIFHGHEFLLTDVVRVCESILLWKIEPTRRVRAMKAT